LDDAEQREDSGCHQAGDAEVHSGEHHSRQGAEQDPGLVEDVEQRERLDPPLAGVRREVCPHGRVEQCAGQTGGR